MVLFNLQAIRVLRGIRDQAQVKNNTLRHLMLSHLEAGCLESHCYQFVTESE